jgi:glyoxylase-like metal-dependent hydrolase (beta-lactamase superfamily II)
MVDSTFTMPPESVYEHAGSGIEPYRQYLGGDGQLTMGCNCFLIVADGRTLLVDTGLGPESNGELMSELRTAGVAPDQIDAVLFTHLHGDHTGWNIDRATGNATFARARYLVPRGDWDHYRAQDEAHSFTRDLAPLEALGCLELVDGAHAVSASLATVSTPGHTPGHLSLAIESGGERAFILGDVVLSLIDADQPEWPNSFDTDHDVARTTRLTTIERLERSGELVGAAHMPVPGLGRFVRVEGRRTWRAEP